MTRSRPFVGSLAFRLLLLASVPFVALAVLADERIGAQRDQQQHAEALVDVIDIRRAAVRVYGPKHVERIAMEGMARVDELGYPRPLVVAATGIDFESLERENHVAFEDALDALQTGCSDLVLSDGTTLGERLGEVRADIDTLRIDLDMRAADPRAVGAAFDRLDAVLGEMLDNETTLDVTRDGHESAAESDQHERLRALAAVVYSAGGRGNELLASILYEDDDRIYEVVRANGRHAALADNYRDLLTDEEAAEFDAVRAQLRLLPPPELEAVAEFDMTTFDTALITTALDSLYNHREYLLALDDYADRMHQEMGEDAQEQARAAQDALRDTWLLLLGVGGLTVLLVILGSAATLLPLRRLTRRAEAISAGNIVVEPLPVRGSNDIRSLDAHHERDDRAAGPGGTRDPPARRRGLRRRSRGRPAGNDRRVDPGVDESAARHHPPAPAQRTARLGDRRRSG